MNKRYTVVGANGGGIKNLTLEEIKEMNPENPLRSGKEVYFKSDGKFYSMKSIDYKEVFGK